jgi:predicted RNase H-like HicB family nuclease
MMPTDEEMIMEYDEVTESYYVIWEPMAVIGMGKTEREALDDLREAANLGIETLINLRTADIVRDSDS